MLKLTRVERQILANQYAILAKVDKSSADYYERARDVMVSGYETAYAWYMNTHEDVLPYEDGQEVGDILQMFRILSSAYRDLKDKSGIRSEDLKYYGFDGNEETGHFAFALFLKSEGKFTEQIGSDGDNSHANMLPRYRRQLQAFERSVDKYQLTKEDLVRIAAAA